MADEYRFSLQQRKQSRSDIKNSTKEKPTKLLAPENKCQEIRKGTKKAERPHRTNAPNKYELERYKRIKKKVYRNIKPRKYKSQKTPKHY